MTFDSITSDPAEQSTSPVDVEDVIARERNATQELVDSEAVASAPAMNQSFRSNVESKQFAILWHPLLSAVASAPDRSKAAEVIVAQFAEMLPDHTVRFGWSNADTNVSGKQRTQLRKLLDSRLGWLGSDNSVFQSLRKGFEKQDEDSKKIRFESANLILDLGQNAEASGRAMIWIRPPQSSDEELQRFSRVIPREVLSTIANVFCSRPVHAHLGRMGGMLIRWWTRRATIGIALLTITLLSCIPVSYRVDASATVTAMNARRVASPIDATLLTAHVRPGDLVRQGDPLLELDGRPLRIELEAITAEIDEATKDEDISLAGGEIAQAQLAGLRRKTLTRRRDLIVNRLDKLIVTSPIDGVVIQGDLQHSLGTPLEIGQTLLEIAPSDSVEIELEIPEVEIGYVDTATPVQFWFPAVGRTKFYSEVSTVYPSATIREDENVFIAKTPMPREGEAPAEPKTNSRQEPRSPVEPKTNSRQEPRSPVGPNALRVGMRGEAVVLGPKRPWVWKWIRLPVRRVGWLIGW